MNFLFLIGLLVFSFIFGVWLLLFLYGQRDVRSVLTAVIIAVMLPGVFVISTAAVVKRQREEYGLSRLSMIMRACKVFFLCVALVPIALNDGIGQTSVLQYKKHKNGAFKKTRQGLSQALSDQAFEYYALQSA